MIMHRPSHERSSRPLRAPARGDALDLLGIAPAAARVLRFYLVRPGAQPHARELQRLLKLGGSSLQREMERLIGVGALERVEEGRRVRYRVVPESPIWRAVGLLESASSDPVPLVQDAVADVAGIHAAFIFGSTARGVDREDSDIDLFVVEDAQVDRRKLLGQLAEVVLLIGREVNVVRYTSQALGERLGDPSHPASEFVRQALSGPKVWVVGDASALRPLAAAAGVSLPERSGSPA